MKELTQDIIDGALTSQTSLYYNGNDVECKTIEDSGTQAIQAEHKLAIKEALRSIVGDPPKPAVAANTTKNTTTLAVAPNKNATTTLAPTVNVTKSTPAKNASLAVNTTKSASKNTTLAINTTKPTALPQAPVVTNNASLAVNTTKSVVAPAKNTTLVQNASKNTSKNESKAQAAPAPVVAPQPVVALATTKSETESKDEAKALAEKIAQVQNEINKL